MSPDARRFLSLAMAFFKASTSSAGSAVFSPHAARLLRADSRTLIKTSRTPHDRWIETATSTATRQLGQTLDDLERWLRAMA